MKSFGIRHVNIYILISLSFLLGWFSNIIYTRNQIVASKEKQGWVTTRIQYNTTTPKNIFRNILVPVNRVSFIDPMSIKTLPTGFVYVRVLWVDFLSPTVVLSTYHTKVLDCQKNIEQIYDGLIPFEQVLNMHTEWENITNTGLISMVCDRRDKIE